MTVNNGRELTFRDTEDIVGQVPISWDILFDLDASFQSRLQNISL